MTFSFLKMHGAANDFVVIDHRRPFLPDDTRALVRQLCDRRRGVGADGVLLLETADDADVAMRYFNADGGAADYCGNGARCLARFALDLGLGRDGELALHTAVGRQTARRSGTSVEVDFGRVDPPSEPVTVEGCGHAFRGRRVLAGVPHFVVPADELSAVPLVAWGGSLRRHAIFGTAGTNVDFVAVTAPGRVRMRTYERGVENETLACGSGAIATALWAAAEGHASPVAVQTSGGDVLEVAFERTGSSFAVTLTGPAAIAFAGTWTDGVPTDDGGGV